MSWNDFLNKEFNEEYYIKLQKYIEEESKTNIIYPSKDKIFYAFESCSFENLKVVILGQDPYHGKDQAHGLAFSILGNKTPPSLRNILKELKNDLNIDRKELNLKDWSEQGVMLLNTVLTVSEGKPNSHKKFGWTIFTDNVIKFINNNKTGVIFILWGNNAKLKKQFIDTSKNHIIESSHPSPMSANRGNFFNTSPFSKCNELLNEKINW